MHAIATLTLMHDRHLSMDDPSTYCPKLKFAESFHWYRAVSSFNDQLSSLQQYDGGKQITASTQIALLTTSAILWTISFSHIEARTPEEAWPLTPTSSSDLKWLGMNNGKEQIWKVTQSCPPDPTAMALASIRSHEMLPTFLRDVNHLLCSIPPAFIRLFNLYSRHSPPSNAADPYYTIGVQVAQVVYVDCPIYTTILSFISFVSGISSEVKGLLEAKDPRMLLVLALWYAKLYHVGVWWMSRRLLLEGQAICIYLERFFPHDADIQALLEFPRMNFRAEVFR
jgi:hypothetical protein